MNMTAAAAATGQGGAEQGLAPAADVDRLLISCNNARRLACQGARRGAGQTIDWPRLALASI